ncbi:MAG TPA: hypothetical protein VD978_30425 [Azospirillum sp.]|nr:hypothetical protein [Azospirillum sp.]
MSTTIALPRPDLSACAWKATKMVVGGVVFIAMSLPVAFPAKAVNPAPAPVVTMGAQKPSAPMKAEAPVGKAKRASSAKLEAVQAVPRKPLPKNA